MWRQGIQWDSNIKCLELGKSSTRLSIWSHYLVVLGWDTGALVLLGSIIFLSFPTQSLGLSTIGFFALFGPSYLPSSWWKLNSFLFHFLGAFYLVNRLTTPNWSNIQVPQYFLKYSYSWHKLNNEKLKNSKLYSLLWDQSFLLSTPPQSFLLLFLGKRDDAGTTNHRTEVPLSIPVKQALQDELYPQA